MLSAPHSLLHNIHGRGPCMGGQWKRGWGTAQYPWPWVLHRGHCRGWRAHVEQQRK